MGQFNRPGRYPLHWHNNGDAAESSVVGCLVHQSYQRGIVTVGSRRVRISGNVVVKPYGHGYIVEGEDHSPQLLTTNLALRPRVARFADQGMRSFCEHRPRPFWIVQSASRSTAALAVRRAARPWLRIIPPREGETHGNAGRTEARGGARRDAFRAGRPGHRRRHRLDGGLLHRRTRHACKDRIVGAVPSSERSAHAAGAPRHPAASTSTTSTRSPVYVDGADEIDPGFCMIKGGGGALTREKIVAAVARHLRLHRRPHQAGRHARPLPAAGRGDPDGARLRHPRTREARRHAEAARGLRDRQRQRDRRRARTVDRGPGRVRAHGERHRRRGDERAVRGTRRRRAAARHAARACGSRGGREVAARRAAGSRWRGPDWRAADRSGGRRVAAVGRDVRLPRWSATANCTTARRPRSTCA